MKHLPSSSFLRPRTSCAALLLTIFSGYLHTAQAAYTVSSQPVLEGSAGFPVTTFQITVDTAPEAPLVLEYATVSGSAVEGVDYTSQRGSVTIPAGGTTAQVTVPVTPDVDVEEDEQFGLVVWLAGSNPAPSLTAIPDSAATLGALYKWRAVDSALPGAFLITGWSSSGDPKPAVLWQSAGIWTVENVFSGPVGGLQFGHVQALAGRWFVGADQLPPTGGFGGQGRLSFQERDRVTPGVWTAANPITFPGSQGDNMVVAMEGSWLAVACGNGESSQRVVRIYEMTRGGQPRETGRIYPPRSTGVGQMTLNGRRLLLVSNGTGAPQVSIYEALDESRSHWRLSLSRTGTGRPVILDGDRLLMGGGGTYHTFERNVGGPDNWGEVATGPAPRDENRSVPAMRGNMLLIGEQGPIDGNNAPGEVRVYVRQTDGSAWVAAGSFTAPAPVIADYFGGRVALTGLNAAVISNSDQPSWTGSFPGAWAVLKNDDLPSIRVRAGSAPEAQSVGESAFVSVELSRATATPVSFTWSTTGITATAGQDYTQSSGSATIPAGGWQTTLRIPLLPDTLVEEDEKVRIAIANVAGASVGMDNAELLIRETRPVLPVVSARVQESYEGAQSALATVEAWSAGATPAVSWRATSVHRVGGSAVGVATPGADFAEISGTTPAGNNYAARSTVIATPADGIVEGDEDFAVLMDAPVAGVAASFAPRVLQPLDTQPQTSSADGQWAAVPDQKQVVDVYERGDVVLFRRDAAAPGGWIEHLRLRAANFGGSVWNVTMLSLRAGTLVFRDARTSELFVFAADEGGPGQWGLVRRIPVVARVNQLSFDGSNLVITDPGDRFGGPVTIEVIEKGSTGRWTQRQELDATGFVYETVQAAVDGTTAAVIGKNAAGDSLLRIFELETGTAVRWRKIVDQTLVTGTPSGIRNVKVSRGVIAVDAFNSTGSFIRMFRRGAGGAWAVEQSLAATGLAGMDRGLILVNRELWAATGAAPSPWRKVSDLPANWDYPMLSPGILTGATRVRTGAGNSTVAAAFIAEPGGRGTIADGDSFSLSHSNALSVMEDFETTVGLRGSVLAQRRIGIPITIPWHTEDGTALAGQDYIASSGVVTIPAGELTGFYTVGVLPDALPEPDETFKVVLGTPSFGVPVVATTNKTIQNRSVPVAWPAFTAPLPEPATGQKTYIVPVPLDYPLPVSTVFSYTISPGTAGAADVLLLDSTVTVPAGSPVIPVPVTVLADALSESTETLSVRINFSTGYYSADGNSSFSLQILDSQHPGLSEPSYSVPQSGTLTVAAPGVLNGNTGGYQRVKLMHAPTHGTLDLLPDGSFNYTPLPGYRGTDRFVFQAIESTTEVIPADLLTNWRWLHPLNGTDPGAVFQANWKLPAFDDSTWGTGTGLIGYGVIGTGAGVPLWKDIGTPPSGQRYTAYLRHAFTSPAGLPAGITMEFVCDDAAIFYLNGTEAGRFAPGPSTAFATAADTYTLLCANSLAEADEPSIQTISAPGNLLAGTNVLAVSLHNQSNTSSDLAFRLHSLRAGMWSHPVTVTINVTDAGLPPLPVADSYLFPEFAPAVDSRLLVNGSLYWNDMLLSDSGTMPDPILEVEVSNSEAGAVTVDVATGHFRMTLTPGFFGTAQFFYRLRDKDGWSVVVPVFVTIPASSPFEVWLETEFESGEFPLSPGVDTDRDGVANLMEYFGRTTPLLGDSGPPLNIALTGSLLDLTFVTGDMQNEPGTLLVQSSATPGVAGSWRTEGAFAPGYSALAPSQPGNAATTSFSAALGKWQHRLQCPAGTGARLYRLRGTTGGQWWRRP